jgi:hypothetical protein
MQSLAFYLYVMAVGFVAAGLAASLAQLVSGEPLRFRVDAKSVLASSGTVLLCVLAGPAILMRNSWRAARAQARSPIWLGLSAMIAGVWSLLSGSVLLDLILKL